MLTRRNLLAAMAGVPLLQALPARGQTAARTGGARIAIIDNRLWMSVKLGDRGPYPFVIDTGSFANLIRADLARELGLPAAGRLSVRGVGGRDSMPLYRASSVVLGQIDIGTSEFAAYDHSELPIHPEAQGALSSMVLTSVDADLDVDRGEWRVHPDGRRPLTGYEQLSSRIEEQVRGRGSPKIHVDVELDGRVFRLAVDSGAPGQVALWGAAAERSGLWNDGAPYVPMRSRGIGGDGANGRLVRARQVKLGSIAFERPIVSLVPGGPRTGDTDGLLGIQLLQRMNIATEMRTRRVWAMRNAQPAPAEHYGMSGLWIEERGARLFVADVSPFSPAADAGLQVGDEVVGTQFRPLIERITRAPGDTVELDVRRGGEQRRVQLILRPFI